MALINDDPAGYTTGNPDAGGPVYPLANRWEEQSRDDAHLLKRLSNTYGDFAAISDDDSAEHRLETRN